jgi:hypothetical protein
MSNDKVAATWHPYDGPTFECPTCERVWGNADSARTCCSLDWLGYD